MATLSARIQGVGIGLHDLPVGQRAGIVAAHQAYNDAFVALRASRKDFVLARRVLVQQVHDAQTSFVEWREKMVSVSVGTGSRNIVRCFVKIDRTKNGKGRTLRVMTERTR